MSVNPLKSLVLGPSASAKMLAHVAKGLGCQVDVTDQVDEAIGLIRQGGWALVFVDRETSDSDVWTVLEQLRDAGTSVPVVLVLDRYSVEDTLRAMRLGAFDCLTRPFNTEEVQAIIERTRSLVPSGQNSAQAGRNGRRLLGRSKKMRELNDLIKTVAGSASTVLIRGESGTGKELVAQALHLKSARKANPIVPVNCGAIPEELLESELFGHVKGSFTGAIVDRPGRFVLADGGTIFLDEIGDMSPKLQVKVLRILQEQELEPVGGTQTIRVDVRVVAATNVDLERAVQERLFREDLYYRLNVIPVEVPPLREHIEDLPMLIEHFLKVFNGRQPRQIEAFSDDAIEMLSRFPWPGNIRELENLVERMTILARGEIVTPEDLPEKFRDPTRAVRVGSKKPEPAAAEKLISTPGNNEMASFLRPSSMPPEHVDPDEGVGADERVGFANISVDEPDAEVSDAATASALPDISVPDAMLNDLVDDYERGLILAALEKTDGVKSRAARMLGIKRTTLVEKMKKKDINYEPA